MTRDYTGGEGQIRRAGLVTSSTANAVKALKGRAPVNIHTFVIFEAIVDAIISALLVTGRRPREATPAWIDAIKRWTDPLWSPAGGELAWQGDTLAALSSGDFECAFRQAAARYAFMI